MHIQGSRTLHARRDAVFAAILDPEMLLGFIPGCREVERTADGTYRGLISLRMPGMAGTYRTTVRPVDVSAPDHGRLEGEVVGMTGTLTGSASFRLADAGAGPDTGPDAHPATMVTYDGQAVIGGPLARLDGRFVEGVARSLVDQGLSRLDARLQAGASHDAAPEHVDAAPDHVPATSDTAR